MINSHFNAPKKTRKGEVRGGGGGGGGGVTIRKGTFKV